MTTLSEKSIGILELPKVLGMLADQACSPGAKAAAETLRPVRDTDEAQRLLDETDAAVRLAGLRGSPSFDGVRDMSAALERADRGGLMTLAELLCTAQLLHAAGRAKTYASENGNMVASCLDGYFEQVSPNKYFEDKLYAAIASEDALADSASPELADIRRKIRLANAKIREILQKMITSQTYSKILQDAIVTMRQGRYVVPVKSEHKSDMPGLVHDVSSSGATIFIEPMAVVETNNEIHELGAKEKKEEERIIASLSAEASSFAEPIGRTYEALTALDLIFARAKLAYAMDAHRPILNTSGRTDLHKAKHPLISRDVVVPIDIALGRSYDTLVITGPNTGGKTVSLKTLGLLCLMAACGLFIPAAEGSEAALYTGIYADIGDEQSIEQSLSTFSSHMKNIISILSADCGNALVLFDELGAGTDPVEGAALAVAIIEYARGCGAKVAATTHYSELKIYALKTEGVENAACEFDVDTLRPTYRLLTGIPGKSNAFAISARLGLTDAVIGHARTLVNGESRRFEEVIENLQNERKELEEQTEKSARLRRQLEENSRKLQKEAEVARAVREKLYEKAAKEASGITSTAKAEAQQILQELEELRKKLQNGELSDNVAQARVEVKRQLRRLEEKSALHQDNESEPAPALQEMPKPGDVIELIRTGTDATVITEPDKDGNLTVSAGIMKLTVPLTGIRITKNKNKESKRGGGVSMAGVTGRGTIDADLSLNLRGMTADEALLELERYLDRAARAGLISVTIIHGKGTGALRTAVQNALRTNKLVASFRNGRYGEGENGVTIVELGQ